MLTRSKRRLNYEPKPLRLTLSVRSDARNSPTPYLLTLPELIQYTIFQFSKPLCIFQSIASQREFIAVSLDSIKDGFEIPGGYRSIMILRRQNQYTKQYSLVRLIFPKSLDAPLSKEIDLNILYDLRNKGSQEKSFIRKLEQKMPFRLGKTVRMKIIGLHTSQGFSKQAIQQSFLATINDIDNTEHKANHMNEPINQICRICLSSQGADQDDILIGCCQCKGSCQFIHLQCLRHWVKDRFRSKLISRQRNKLKARLYQFIKYNCEICKYQFPKLIKKNENIYSLVDVEIPNLPFITIYFETSNYNYFILVAEYPSDASNREKSYKNGRFSISFGNSIHSDITIQTSGISNQHAEIFYISEGEEKTEKKNSNFYLKDMGSSEGTYVPIENEIKISTDSQFFVSGYKFGFKPENKN